MAEFGAPDLVPVLSRGKHRNPRKGACFMELASYLAGERWSDHPACTHPLLAGLARLVNDYTSDEARPRLARHIPSVIGLTSDDRRIDALIALRCATVALPVVAAERQRVLAVSILAAERALAELDRGSDGGLDEAYKMHSRQALAQVPHAAQWAERFAARLRHATTPFLRYGAPSAVRHAVEGIAHACVPDPDALLRDLLVAVIEDCARVVRGTHNPDAPVDVAAWAEACRLTA